MFGLLDKGYSYAFRTSVLIVPAGEPSARVDDGRHQTRRKKQRENPQERESL